MTVGTAPAYPSRSAGYSRDRRRQKAYGRWQPYTDAEPVRAHVRDLMDFGIGWMRVAHLAGVPRATVSMLLYGSRHRGLAPTQRIRPETAEKLLSVQPAPALLASAADTDGTGTRRRLQALVAGGWPQARLAARLGMGRANFGRTIISPRVLVSTERAVRTLYDDLWNLDPREHGVTTRYYDQARAIAKSNGWAPVGAWDDDTIDNPDAFPDWTGACGTARGYRAHYTHHILPACRPCLDAAAADRHERRSAHTS